MHEELAILVDDQVASLVLAGELRSFALGLRFAFLGGPFRLALLACFLLRDIRVDMLMMQVPF